MPVSLRIPSEKEEMLKKAAAKSKKTKTAYILDAIDEKLVSLRVVNRSLGNLRAGSPTKKRRS